MDNYNEGRIASIVTNLQMIGIRAQVRSRDTRLKLEMDMLADVIQGTPVQKVKALVKFYGFRQVIQLLATVANNFGGEWRQVAETLLKMELPNTQPYE